LADAPEIPHARKTQTINKKAPSSWRGLFSNLYVFCLIIYFFAGFFAAFGAAAALGAHATGPHTGPQGSATSLSVFDKSSTIDFSSTTGFFTARHLATLSHFPE
jgi:hypothetical protein